MSLRLYKELEAIWVESLEFFQVPKPIWEEGEGVRMSDQCIDIFLHVFHILVFFHISSYFPLISSYFPNISSDLRNYTYKGESSKSHRRRGKGAIQKFHIYPWIKIFGGRPL